MHSKSDPTDFLACDRAPQNHIQKLRIPMTFQSIHCELVSRRHVCSSKAIENTHPEQPVLLQVLAVVYIRRQVLGRSGQALICGIQVQASEVPCIFGGFGTSAWNQLDYPGAQRILFRPGWIGRRRAMYLMARFDRILQNVKLDIKMEFEFERLLLLGCSSTLFLDVQMVR